MLIAVRYILRVVGMGSKFYKLTARDPTYAKMVMPSHEQRNDVATADDLTEPLEKLENHIATQLMKAGATLGASNATMRAGKGAPAK